MRTFKQCFSLITLVSSLSIFAPFTIGGVIAHNGTVTSGGTGDVDVDMLDSSAAGQYNIARQFNQLGTHVLLFGDPASPLQAIADFNSNNTPYTWTGYRIDFYGADILTPDGLPAPEINPIVPVDFVTFDRLWFFSPSGDVTVASSSITRSRDVTQLLINFDQPVAPGSSFSLVFFPISKTGETFYIAETPFVAVPEPSTLLLAGPGLLGIFVVRKIRRRI